MAGKAMLQLNSVTRDFPGVRALDAVSFTVLGGEVHGLIGENGAGKSTLMAIASGALAPTDGQVFISGKPIKGDPDGARELGLAIVHQEPALMPDLTVAENIFLGMPHKLRPQVSGMAAFARQALDRWNPDLSFGPEDVVSSLNPEQRFITEIAKALAAQPRILVLDEPTEHLGAEDVRRLFARIRELTAGGASVVYISHRIREVREIAERVTVLRDGQGQGTYPMDTLDEGRIIELIVGSAIEHPFPEKGGNLVDAKPVLMVRNFSGDGFRDVSMAVRHGEILGLAGIDANGQREFLRALAGRNAGSGNVEVNGKAVSVASPGQARKAGIGFLPGDRHHEGILADLSVRENFSIRSTETDTVSGLVSEQRERSRVRDAVAGYNVKTPSIETPIRSLSGGNQQKLILSSVVGAEPAVMLIDEPTQGVDIGARAEIYRILREIANNGTTIIVVSSDAAEIAGLCDRVMVFSRGQIVRELKGDDVVENNITEAVLTSTTERHRYEKSIGWFWKWAAGHWAPIVLVGLAILAVGAYASSISPFYLSARNFSGMLALVGTLALVAYGQQFVLLIGEIDLSVGPVMGLGVVVGSFFFLQDAGPAMALLGIVMVLAAALGVGFLNFLLTEKLGMHAMVATLATFIAVQAVSLTLRPQPDGLIGPGVYNVVGAKIGFVPVLIFVAVALALFLEFGLLRTGAGIALRGFGSRRESARVAGISPFRTRLAAYLLCSFFAGLAAFPLMIQVGIGDPKSGINYTLASIAAVVIGGASLAGGRGTFLGALFGALMLNQVNVVATFLRLSDAWTFYLQGIMILLGVAIYSHSRRMAASH
ncbi:ABC transporter [Zhengella mangrovi]|uniref:ABC transporter n=2 Tax=Zhengella mangrovi TaxID=1982044 RepID=A0A2G1QNY2_9HYPH|nr:ABC transporter [Zhengella mangrovi]